MLEINRIDVACFGWPIGIRAVGRDGIVSR